MSEWQPIATAPKDGSSFLAYQPKNDLYPEAMAVCSYSPRYGSLNIDWVYGHDVEYEVDSPTHWRPLPPPPK